jgi:tetratricopeptide (TPR) repeat protein
VRSGAAAMLLAGIAFVVSPGSVRAQDGAGASTPPDSYSSFGTGDALLRHAVTLIAAGTPASLAEGRRLAETADSIGAAGAAGAGIVARDLQGGLSPASADPVRANGLTWDKARITSPFLDCIAHGLLLLDPEAAVEDAGSLRARLLQADKLVPQSPLPPFFQGLLLEKGSGALPDIRVQFETALRRSAAFAPAAAGLARTIIASGTAPSELPLLQHLASLLPTEPQRFAALARAALAAGRFGIAADAAAQGLLRAPNDPSFALLRAQALAGSGDWYQSLWVLDALLRLRPDLVDAILLKARLLHENAENDAEAIALLLDAEARYPAEAALPELRARVLLDGKRTQEAVTALRRAHELAPQKLPVLSLLVSISAKAEQWNEASQWLSMIPESSRTAEDLRLAWLISNGLGDHAQAEATALRLFQVAKEPGALAMEARSMLASGRPEKARLVIDHVLGTMDPAPRLSSDLHFLRSQSGSEDPLRDLRTALKENPDNGEALAAIADVLAGQKDYRNGMEYAKRAAAMAPDNASLAQKARELARLAAAQ